MKKFFLALSVSLLIIVLSVCAVAADSGKCGENLTWTLDDNGTLTISGEGDMDMFILDGPWNSSKVKTVIIENGVTSIGDCAFNECYNLTSIEIPDSMEKIGNSAFGWCANLTSIEFPESVYSIGECAFYGCSNLTSVELPPYLGTINMSTFSFCSNLKSVVIPDSVESIGKFAFSYCTKLDEVIISDSVRSIGEGAFDSCTNLSSIAIPGFVTSIGENAFGGCSNLTSIAISDSVTSIGQNAFYGCSDNASLYYTGTQEDWDKISINSGNDILAKESVTFNYIIPKKCGENLTCVLDNDGTLTISGEGDMYNWEYLNRAPWKSESVRTVVFEGNITSIGSYAFYDCGNLTNIVIPENVTKIGYSSFSDCYNLESVKLQNGLICIEERAFDCCQELKTIEIPRSITRVYHDAFVGCILEKIIYSGTQDEWNNIEMLKGNESLFNCENIICLGNTEEQPPIWDNYIRDTGNLENNITWSLDAEGTLTITGSGEMPNWDTEYGAPWKYPYMDSIKKVVIENGITNIGEWAFDDPQSLTSVEIPDSVTSIRDFAFMGCESLTSIEISDNVVSIGEDAFSGCTSLTSINIPKSVASLGNSAFEGCANVENIYVDAENPNFCSDENGALYNKNKTVLLQYPLGNQRTSYAIPDSVTSIGPFVFCDSQNLISIEIPKSVTFFGDRAFADCYNLETVYYCGSEDDWNAIEKDYFAFEPDYANVVFNHTPGAIPSQENSTNQSGGNGGGQYDNNGNYIPSSDYGYDGYTSAGGYNQKDLLNALNGQIPAEEDNTLTIIIIICVTLVVLGITAAVVIIVLNNKKK